MAFKTTTSPLEELVHALDRAEDRVCLASPFIGEDVGLLLAELLVLRRVVKPKLEVQVITALPMSALRYGYSSVEAVRALVRVGEVRAVSNLHAKLAVVDERFALLGSNNLTGGGVGATNVELGVTTNARADVLEVASRFDGWWRDADRPGARVDLKTLKDVKVVRPRRSARAHVAGVKLETERSEYFESFRERHRITSTIGALEAGLLRPGAPLPKRNVRRHDTPPAAIYDVVRRLRRPPTALAEEVRAVLVEVVQRHRVAAARAHAARRLGLDHGSPKSRRGELRDVLRRAKKDPSDVVRRAAGRALADLE